MTLASSIFSKSEEDIYADQILRAATQVADVITNMLAEEGKEDVEVR